MHAFARHLGGLGEHQIRLILKRLALARNRLRGRRAAKPAELFQVLFDTAIRHIYQHSVLSRRDEADCECAMARRSEERQRHDLRREWRSLPDAVFIPYP